MSIDRARNESRWLARKREREEAEADAHWSRVGEITGLSEEAHMQNPFDDIVDEPPDLDSVDEPPEPGPIEQMTNSGEIGTGPYHVAYDELAEVTPQMQELLLERAAAKEKPEGVPVYFPVVMVDRGGHPMPVPFEKLEEPARRVAELVELLQSALAPPAVVRELEALVTKANALEVTDAESYKQCADLYELLHGNEKGIEESIGRVVAFFHSPWNAMCKFRAQFAKPVAEAKQRLSAAGGAWQLAETRKAEQKRRDDERAAAEQERERLRQLEAKAREQAATEAAKGNTAAAQQAEQTAVVVAEMVKEVTAPALPLVSTVPATNGGTRGRKEYEVEITDAEAFYKALVEDATRRVAAPIDMAYLKAQAKDLKTDIGKRFPGVTAREKGGLTAAGRR